MTSISWIILSLAAIQMIIAAIITQKNKKIFNKYPAHQFKNAVNELEIEKPFLAKILTLMYALLPLEYIVVLVSSK